MTKDVRMIARNLTAAIALICSASAAFAHGGGLDASGCHHNRKTGDYHCHRAPSNQGQSVAPSRGVEPTCHVGPRGGTYTITPSGKKNYKGC